VVLVKIGEISEQLDDLLGARDEKTANIEKTLIRIEGKLDKAIQ